MNGWMTSNPMRTSTSSRPVVLITMGDARGIGPEVTLKTLSKRSVRSLADFLIIGDLRLLKKTRDSLNIGSFDLEGSDLDMGTDETSKAPLKYIDKAVLLITEKKAAALVTAPVNKEEITKAGTKFTGHTEYLAGAVGAEKIAMMFVGKDLTVTTVTRHIPLMALGRELTAEKIIDASVLTIDFLKKRSGMKCPRVGICAVNPHAGEGGVLGREESDIIGPAAEFLKKKYPGVQGPLPADSAFNSLYAKKLDCLVAMYHDQAMIPVKMLAREDCVNVTLGLPFVRTSPAHGTAYDIAGRGIADPAGMTAAVKLACRLAGR